MSARGARLEYQKSIDLRQEHWAATQATNYLDFMADLSIDRDPRTIRNSGLICTIGNSFKVEVSPKFYYIPYLNFFSWIYNCLLFQYFQC